MVTAIAIQTVTTMDNIGVSSFPSEDAGPGATRAGCVSDAMDRPYALSGRRSRFLERQCVCPRAWFSGLKPGGGERLLVYDQRGTRRFPGGWVCFDQRRRLTRTVIVMVSAVTITTVTTMDTIGVSSFPSEVIRPGSNPGRLRLGRHGSSLRALRPEKSITRKTMCMPARRAPRH